jgi:UDP-N-acetylglucosamine 2-epimerase (non-hydrolysing)
MTPQVLIVFGTRPELIKLAPLILQLRKSAISAQVLLVSTGQHDELLEEQLNYWQIIPDVKLNQSAQKISLSRLLAQTLLGLQDVVDRFDSFRYLLVQGDTNTALATANVAFLNKLKLVHVEAGLRSFDLDNPFPEEYNRAIASKVAYFHFAPTETSKANLMQEGISQSRILVVGNTVIDALQLVQLRENVSQNNHKSTVLITMHRRENLDQEYLTLIELIAELAAQYQHLHFVWVAHPNNYVKIVEKLRNTPNLTLTQNKPFNEFIQLYQSCILVLTDSGGVTEEAASFGIPIVVFRKKTERMEPLAQNYPMLVSTTKQEILNFFHREILTRSARPYLYGAGDASAQIVSWLTQELQNQYNNGA